MQSHEGANHARDARKKLGLSQKEFAAKFGLSIRTLQDWEQAQRDPDGAARVLLQVIAENPDAVARAAKRLQQSG